MLPKTHPSPPEVSVVVPAWREAENLPALVGQVSAALAGRSFEIVIVDDDSNDGTVEACAELAGRFPVRLVVRKKAEHGLSGAVLHGIAASTGTLIVVMDADLQHPPAAVPALLGALDHGADFALGSRYVPGGSTYDKWTLFRKLNSGIATLLARPFSGGVRDPMSGFFALRRATFDGAERLTPLGYKIALELMCKCRVKRVREVPIHFGMRERGRSKLTLSQQFKYLEHLSRLYDFSYPRASPIVKFLVAVTGGFVAGSGWFLALTRLGGAAAAATASGYLASILVTAVFHLRYVRTQRPFLVTPRPWGDFWVIATAELVAVVATAEWLGLRAPGAWREEAFAICFGVGLVVRYVLRKELLHDIRGLRREVTATDRV